MLRLILEAPCLCLSLLFFVSLPPSLALYYTARAVNPSRLQILRIDWERNDRRRNIARHMRSFEQNILLILIDLLKLQWHTRVYEGT